MRPHLLALLITAAPTISWAQDQPDVPGDEDDYDYGDAHTYELGGSLGATFADNLTTVTLSPSFGYFIIEHLELSGTFTFAYTRIEDDMGVSASNSNVSLIAEPSYHLPISKQLQVLGGLGVGAGYNGDFFDFEIVPRIGLNILTTRSSIITPSMKVPIKIGRQFGDVMDDVGTDLSLLFEVGITTTW
jgi:hypothetical protein